MRKLLILLGLLIPTFANGADVGQLTITAFPTENLSESWDDFALNGTTDTYDTLFQAEEACTITDLCYRYGARTGTPPTYVISLQGIGTDGLKDGTIKSSTNAKITFTPPADTTQNNTVQCKTLTSSYAATRGEFLATSIGYSSGTVDGSNNGTFTYQSQGMRGLDFPHGITVDAGTPTRRNGLAPYGYKCGSTYYGNLWQSVTLGDFGANSTGDERGNIFTIPSTSCSTFKLDGARFYSHLNAATSTVTAVVYEGTTVRQTLALDTDFSFNNTQAARWLDFTFTENYTFSCGTAYRVVLKPTANSPGAGLFYVDFPAAGAMNSLPLGTSMSYTFRTDAGAFDDTTTTRRAQIQLVLSDITAASGTTTRRANFNSGLN